MLSMRHPIAGARSMTKLAGLLLALVAGSAAAADLYPWHNHAPPFGFKFENEIDSHQQTRKAREGGLFGFFYVRFTGVVTRDHYGVATHVDCNAYPDCTVGWTLNGKATRATSLYQTGNDHPVFLVSRPDIPQPGAHAHFHWLGPLAFLQEQGGYLLQLTAVDRFCFIHQNAEAAPPDRKCRDNGGIT
ncbi:MAG TPA: hypothetical protein VFK10_16310, partial [Burkholderiaceae bacterium]|nr:hypothetical protein [Burkholderiaceae bacterium]